MPNTCTMPQDEAEAAAEIAVETAVGGRGIAVGSVSDVAEEGARAGAGARAAVVEGTGKAKGIDAGKEKKEGIDAATEIVAGREATAWNAGRPVPRPLT